VSLCILGHGNDRRPVGLFTGIEGIVHEFLEDGEAPAIPVHPELHRELAFGKEL
jgi:hypothetical protein